LSSTTEPREAVREARRRDLIRAEAVELEGSDERGQGERGVEKSVWLLLVLICAQMSFQFSLLSLLLLPLRGE
jgi:hypothetical protein